MQNEVVPELERRGDSILIKGSLTFATITNLIGREPELLNEMDTIKIDLSSASKIDSAGLALLIHWKNFLKKQRKDLKFVNIPPQIQAMIDIRGIGGVFHGSQ